ncbi:hypothetical protein C5142_18250 [Rhodococcus sp. BGS-1C]|uniref:hypothetical protein n=1 Tax=Rhodococcus sp. BGS-1C TaxID=2100132 RepID=UPI003DA0D276
MAGFITGRQTYRTLVADPNLAPLIGDLDGIEQALAADARAEALLAVAAEPARELDDDVEHIVDTGVVDPARIAELAGHHSRAAERESERTVLLDIRARVTRRLESSVLTATPDLLAALHGQLTDLTDLARPHAETIAGIETAAAAIEAGPDHVAAWSALAGHRREYDSIRRSQELIMISNAGSHWDRTRRSDKHPATANDAFVANLDELWPSWRATRKAGLTAGLDPAGGIRADMISGTRLNGHPWPDNDPVAELAWLVRHAELWVPTPSQLDALWTERTQQDQDRTRELAQAAKQGKQSEKRLGHSERAIADWHTLTGR